MITHPNPERDEKEALELVREAFMLRLTSAQGFVLDESWKRWAHRAQQLLLSLPSVPDDLDELRRRLS